MIKCSNSKVVDVDSLVPNPKNPNKHPTKQIKLLAKIIKHQGQRLPIIVSKRSGFIVSGHGRLEAIKSLKWTECAIDEQDFATEADEYAHMVADNKIAELADHDDAKMIFDLKDMKFDLDLDLLGMLDFKLPEDPVEAQCDENEIPEQVDTRCKRGDIWQLGNHRLLCGDSTLLDDVQKLMGDEKVSLVVTDPPYNINYEGKTKQKLKIKNDHMGDNTFYQFLLDVFTNYFTIMLDGASIYVFHADTEGLNFRKSFVDAGLKLSQCLVWVKNSLVMGRNDYHWKHEPILYGWKEGASHSWMSDRKQTTVWNFDRPTKSTDHPTMKPINLIEYPILNSSAVGSLVLDLFGGSGSTLIACEKTNRKCFMMELDEHYCDVILTRWEKYTGQTACLTK